MSETRENEIEHDEPLHPNVKFEGSDLGVFYIFMIGAFMIVWALIMHAALWQMFKWFEARESYKGKPVSSIQAQPQQPPEPRLQSNPVEDLRKMDAEQNAVLNNYGWVDRQNGVVRIPIEQAIDLIAARGLSPTNATTNNAATNAAANATTNAATNVMPQTGVPRPNNLAKKSKAAERLKPQGRRP